MMISDNKHVYLVAVIQIKKKKNKQRKKPQILAVGSFFMKQAIVQTQSTMRDVHSEQATAGFFGMEKIALVFHLKLCKEKKSIKQCDGRIHSLVKLLLCTDI